MTKTKNYNLNQWDAHDPVRRGDFNADNAAIDAALRAVSDTAAGKADAESVSALEQSVTALSTALGTGGQNCRIQFGSYTGNGKYGSGSPNTLTPGFCPLAAMVAEPYSGSVLGWPTNMIRGCPNANGVSTYGHTLTVSWSDSAVSWYASNADYQMNQSGTTYYYVVWGV